MKHVNLTPNREFDRAYFESRERWLNALERSRSKGARRLAQEAEEIAEGAAMLSGVVSDSELADMDRQAEERALRMCDRIWASLFPVDAAITAMSKPKK